MTAVTVAAATFLLSLPIFADKLVVTINNLKEAGEIHVALYDNAEAFEADRGEKGGRPRVSRKAPSNLSKRVQ